MKTIIAGSRSLTAFEMLERTLATCPWKITEVVSGGAIGVDSMGEEWARMHGIPLKVFPVSKEAWRLFGQRAAMARNEAMGNYAEGLVAIWDGESNGTRHMLDYARSMELRLHLMVFRKIGDLH